MVISPAGRSITLAIITLGCVPDDWTTRPSSDAGSDIAATDTPPIDAGPIDAGPIDAGPIDAGPIDAGPIDVASGETALVDTTSVDTFAVDVVSVDSGTGDSVAHDTAPIDVAASDVTSGDVTAGDATPGDAGCPPGAGPANLYRAENNTNDSVGGQNSPFSNASHAAGRFGQAFSFRGNASPSYVVLPPTVGDFGVGDFTLVFWISTTSPIAVSDVLSRRSACTGSTIYPGHDVRMGGVAGNLHVELWTSLGFYVLDTPSGLRVNDGQWHQVALLRAGASAQLNVDGATVATVAIAGGMNDPTGTPTHLGTGPCVPNGPGLSAMHDNTAWFEGRIDEVGFFRRALSVGELAASAQGRCPPGP